MTKVILTFICIFFLALPLFAQSVDTAWVRAYNGPAALNEGASSIALDGSGNVYVTGTSQDSWTGFDINTIKYNSNGDTLWVRRYTGTGDSSESVSGIAVDNLGNVYLTGYSNGEYATIKYNSNGSIVWVRKYDGPETASIDEGPSIVVDNSHNVYVTGFSYSSGTKDDYGTIKYNSNGDTVWVRKYNGPPGSSMDGAYAIAIDSSSNVYVTGYSWGGVTMGDYATIKYYSNGDTAWVRRYDGAANNQDYACDIAVDNSGNVYVTGYGYGNYFSEYVTIKYYPNGDTAWLRRYKNTGSDLAKAYALAVDSSGNVYVTGYSFGSGTSFDYATIKYNTNGDNLWVRRYNGPGNAFDHPFAIALDGSGNAYVTGYSDDGTGTDWATIKYNSNGDSVWVRIYNGPANGNDAASSIVVDESGNVYVTGGSENSGGYSDFCTIKYIQFLRGDANSDKKVSLSDIVYLINYLFKFGPAPEPNQAGDANCDGKVSLSDIVYLINYLFKFGPAPCI